MSSSSFCPRCGKQYPESGARFCSACGAEAVPAASQPFAGTAASGARLVRPRSPRMIAGVCSGIALYYGWDLSLVRILFAIFFCLSLGTGTILYLAGWVLMPDGQQVLPVAPPPRQGDVV
jgi:phage shock protein C